MLKTVKTAMIRHLCSTVYWVCMCVQVRVCVRTCGVGGGLGTTCASEFSKLIMNIYVSLPYHSDPLHSGWLKTKCMSHCLERIQTCVLCLIVLVFCARGKKLKIIHMTLMKIEQEQRVKQRATLLNQSNHQNQSITVKHWDFYDQ